MARTQMCSRDRRGVRNEGEEGEAKGRRGDYLSMCAAPEGRSPPPLACTAMALSRSSEETRATAIPIHEAPKPLPLVCVCRSLPLHRGRCRSGRCAVAALLAAATASTPARPPSAANTRPLLPPALRLYARPH